jgi:hypothetical protein
VASPVQSSRPGTSFWFAIAAAVGVAVELTLSLTAHHREAWDSEYYWIFGVPVMILAAFICGLFARRAPVRIGYAPFLGQLITMVVRTGGGSMLPLGIILIGVIGLSGVLAAFVGAAIGKRLPGNSPSRIPPASGSTDSSA